MGTIYLMNSGLTDRYKIGVSKNTHDRIKGLQTGNPEKLTLVSYFESDIYIKIETILHRTFKHKKYVSEDFENLKGEWFILSNEDVSKFKESCEKIEKAIKCLKNNSTLDFSKETFF